MNTNNYDAELVAEIRQEFDDTLEGERLFYHKLWEMQLIPFDMVENISENVLHFGFLGVGDLIGRYVRVGAVPIVKTDAGDYDFSNSVGVVVGDASGRVVVRIENLFFGWLDPHLYEFADNYVIGTNTLQ